MRKPLVGATSDRDTSGWIMGVKARSKFLPINLGTSEEIIKLECERKKYENDFINSIKNALFLSVTIVLLNGISISAQAQSNKSNCYDIFSTRELSACTKP